MQTDHKKEYDRKRAENVYKEFIIRRERVLELLGGECYLCGNKAVKGFHLHHKEYHPVESDYPRHSKSMYVRLKRVKEAEENPQRFSLLCPYHHKIIEQLKFKTINRERLYELISK